jgi:hypothetical protein
MAQMSMNANWTLKLNNDEMKLVTLALAGKLKTDELTTAARELLEHMTRGRLAVVAEQANVLQRHLDNGEEA